MRTLILSALIFVTFSFISIAQDWFPLEVGNISMSRYAYQYMGADEVDYYFVDVTADSILDGQNYYYVKNHSDRDGLYESFWLRYDQENQLIYQWGNDTSVVFMDFNIPNGGQFTYLNPITGISTLRTVFESTATHFGRTRNTKGFVDGFWAKMKEWIDTVGVKPFGSLKQVLQISSFDTTYFEYNKAPDFTYFHPVLKTNQFNFSDTFLVWHDYSLLMGPHPKDFIDYLCLDTYYKSNTDSIPGTKIYSTFCPWYGQKISFQLDQNLIKHGYEFYYNVTAKDKGLIPKYRTRPITGYYTLVYDPSPAQVLFSKDSIYIPTLTDSGSVKIVNTSDHSVKIDSIISVGSFYGYRGFLSKPGFEYPFYLFQTLPSPQWNDTLGIVIPPHDSINVSFYEVDLCPICDYEVQDYFKDTLRFVFTFMDGNVYSFSKSIPISGEGHPSDVEDIESLPKEFALSQNYPNPFNPSTKISWQSPVSSWQILKIYDVLGNEVVTIVNEYRDAGNYETEFNAEKLSSGVYYYQLRAGDFVETKKMILLR
jgi:hypothetical protein